MIVSKGNIKLIRLREEDTELVRQWRNSPSISRYMNYREHITPEMQAAWFRSINNEFNLYFIIEYKGGKVGLINAKDIDWEKKTTESGVFFWDEHLQNTQVPLLILMIFAELGMRHLNLSVYAHILSTNHRARRYNTLLGFQLCEGQENKVNQLYILTRENYMRVAGKISKAYFTLSSRDPLTILLEKEDYDIGIAQRIEKLIDPVLFSEVKEAAEGKLIHIRL